MISFIVPFHKNRSNHLTFLPSNLEETYYSNYELIIAEQTDDKLFRRGQLCNLGFKKSIGDLIVFLDVDIRFMEYVDFWDLAKTYSKPVLHWNYRNQISEDSLGNLKKIGERIRTTTGYGGCSLVTREHFIASDGFSNLPIGWGAEDTIYDIRVGGHKRLKGNLYHIKHPTIPNQNSNSDIKRNRDLLKTHSKRSPKDDSWTHTIAEGDSECGDGNHFRHCKFNDITVKDSCPYYENVKKVFNR